MPHFFLWLALATAPLRLADLLQEARDKNPDLKSQAAKAASARAAIAPAGALEDPMLMVQLWNAPLDFSNIPVMVQLTQPLQLGGKRAARRSAAAAEAEIATASQAVQLHDLEVQVAQAYFELFLAERTLELEDEQEGLVQQLLLSAQTRVSTGRGEQVELLRAQGAGIQLRSERETARDQRASAWARLSVLLDRDPSATPGQTTAPGVLDQLPPEPELRLRAWQQRPELRAARAMVEQAEAQAQLARAETVPDLAPFLGLMHTFRGVGETNFLFAGVQGNLPLFVGEKSRPRVESASLLLQSQREAGRAAKNRVTAEVAESYAHLLAETHQIALHHELIPLSRQAALSASHSYAAGRLEFSMVIDSLRDLRMHELELAQHLALYEERLAELQRAVGGELFLEQSAEAGHANDH